MAIIVLIILGWIAFEKGFRYMFKALLTVCIIGILFRIAAAVMRILIPVAIIALALYLVSNHSRNEDIL